MNAMNIYNISCRQAEDFLRKAKKETIKKLWEQYFTDQDIIDDAMTNSESFEYCIKSLAESLPDTSLYALGYDMKKDEQTEEYNYIIPTEKQAEIEEKISEYGDINILNKTKQNDKDTIITVNKLLDLDQIEDLYAKPLNSGYDFSFDNVVAFLMNLDSDTIEELMHKYNADTYEDLATAITDYELEVLGYSADNEGVNKIYRNDKTTNRMVNDDTENQKKENYFDAYVGYDNQDYDECLDFLEEVDDDILYDVLDKANCIFITDSDISFNRFKDCLDPNLVESCELLNSEEYAEGKDNYVTFKVNTKQYSNDENNIKEDVVINKTLNKNIFDTSTNKMLPEVREQLLAYAQGFIDKMKENDINIEYNDIQLLGSNAGFLYNPEGSDIDIHFKSASPLDNVIFERLVDEFDIYEAENPFIIGNSVVELGIEDDYLIAVDNKDPRRYSLVSDEWVNDSDKNEVYTEKDLDNPNIAGYKEVVQDYSDKIEDVINSDEFVDAIELKQEIRQNRSTDLANIGSLSLGNVVFKELRANGMYGKLKDYIKTKSKALGVDN